MRQYTTAEKFTTGFIFLSNTGLSMFKIVDWKSLCEL